MSLDTKFITNEKDNKLEDRLNSKLGDCKSFDCLVGYFYVDGFYKLQDQLENVDKIRILVGMSVGSRVFKIIEESSKDIKNKDIKDSSIDEKDKILLSWIKEKKVEIKALNKVHSKLYLMGLNDDEGCAIVGSSNLTASGLSNNGELNVELNDNEDYKYLLDKFNTLWDDESTEITKKNVNTSRYNAYTFSNSNNDNLRVVKEPVDLVKDIDNVKDKIYKKSKYLNDFDSMTIRKGTITGNNNVFIINKDIRDNLIQKDSNNTEIIKPIIKQNQVKKWNISPEENYVIITNGIKITQYPEIEKYLTQFEKELKSKNSKNKKWYELSDPFYLNPEKPKLIFKCESSKDLFAVFTDKFTFPSGGSYVLIYDDKRVLKLIQALLSSNVLNFIYRLYQNNDDGYVGDRIIKNEFPLKFPENKEEEDRIIELVDELQRIDYDDYAQNLEVQLNDIIYELYGLNNDEIQVIEEYLES